MLSFELSVIDIAIMIAVVILALLFLLQKKAQPTNKSESLTEGQKELPDEPSVT
jgi:hypothetical protein